MIDVVQICYPGVGGQAAVATGLAVEAAKAGSRHAIVFYGVEQTAEQYVRLCDDHEIPHTTIVKIPGIGIGARRKLRKAINNFGAETVIAHHHDTCITACIGLMVSSKNTIFVEHHSNALKSRKDWILSTLAHQLSDHTVYLTQAYRSRVSEKVGRFHKHEKTSVITNGLDLDLYPDSKQKHAGEIVIGMQGRMDEGKDFALLLDAFSRLQSDFSDKNLSLELIGDGPHRHGLESCSTSNVTFCGFLPHKELVEKMRYWDIAVLATEGETLSMAVLESWALAIPLIASDVPGVGDLIRDGQDGLLFESKSSTALCERLTQIISDQPYADHIGQRGRERVECSYNRKNVWQEYQKLIQNLQHSAMPQVEEAKVDSLH
ncbi:MAG: glycosyltransferase family 4 protein [Akkermansiaceae bacterium]